MWSKNGNDRDVPSFLFSIIQTVIGRSNMPILCSHSLRRSEVIFHKGKSRGFTSRIWASLSVWEGLFFNGLFYTSLKGGHIVFIFKLIFSVTQCDVTKSGNR